MRSLETSDTFVIEFDFADSEGSEGMKVVHIDNDVYLFPEELVEKLWISKGGRLSALVSSLWKPLLQSHTVQLLDCKSTSYSYCCGLGVLSDVIYFRLWREHALHLQRCLQC